MKKRISHNSIHIRTARRRVALTLLFGMLLMACTSCGKKETAAAPELLEPVALTDSYRPAEKRDIGEVNFLTGIVVPETYPVFSKKTFFIYELKVSPGDHVDQGDVIAVGDTREIDQELNSLSRQLAVLKQQRSSNEYISKKTEAKLEYLKKASVEAGLAEEAAACETEIKKEQENRRYDLASADASISETNKQISKLREEKAKLTFTAPHSGQVTFLVDISSSNMIAANTNIAVISDFDNLYIEANEKTDSYKYKDYEEKYIMVDGKKVPVEEYPFTSTELSYANSVGQYPQIRFRTQGTKLEAGATVPVYFTRVSCTDVLSVGNDSVYQEGESYYCYVLGTDGQRERRELVLGARDSLYSEVKSGVAEGEQVFYDNKAVMPAKYQAYTVETGEYTEEHESEYFAVLPTKHEIMLAESEGSVQEVKTSPGSEVTKGQELLTLSIPSDKGPRAEQKNRKADVEQGHTAQVKEFAEREKELKAELEAAKKAKDTPQTPAAPEAKPEEKENKEDKEKQSAGEPAEQSDEKPAGPTQEEKEALRDSKYLVERLQLDLEILAEERKLEAAEYEESMAQIRAEMAASASASGSTITVTAASSGTLGQEVPGKDTTVTKGQYLFTINSEGEKLLRVNMPVKRGQAAATAAMPGQRITFTADGKEYTGTCVAENGTGKPYLFTRDGEVHMTTSPAYSSGNDEQFIVKMDDESFFAGEELPSAKAKFQGVEVHGATIVPSKCVYSEQDTLTQKTSCFVWKVTESGLSKQGVTVYEAGQYSDYRLILSGLMPGDVIAQE